MTNFIQKLFAKTENRNDFPKISFGMRLEGIGYETETHSLYIDSTYVSGRRLYTDSIDKWKNGDTITQLEKETIFDQVIKFINNKEKAKPIVVINGNLENEFWERVCKKYKEQINQIEYDSNEKKGKFQFNMLFQSVQNKGTLIIDDKTIKTEVEFRAYWQNRKSK